MQGDEPINTNWRNFTEANKEIKSVKKLVKEKNI